MKWSNTFRFKGRNIYYNRIRFNNPSERCVEVSIGFDFLALLPSKTRILEVGNVLSHYENSLSEYLAIRSRKIIDKFESELGIEQWDLMDMPLAEKYDAIVSISTVEHIGQGVNPIGSYGETILERDLEAPLQAICKIYELLSAGGKALITVPFGKLIDGGWYIQFSREYLQLLTSKYGVPKSAISTEFLKKVDMQRDSQNPYQLWEEKEANNLETTEYNWPFPHANAIAVIELNKVAKHDSVSLKIEPTQLVYHKPVVPQLIYKSELETGIQPIKIENQAGIKQTIIIIDGVFFQLYSTGIARVWRSLLEQWAYTEFSAHIIVLDRLNTSPQVPGIKYRTIPAYSYNNTDTDKQMLQQVCDEEGADLFISTYYTTPLSTPSVFIAYDMIPEVVGADFNEPMWREKHHAISHASSYISISESTARDLVKFFPDITSQQVTVAHCGVAPIFTPATATEISPFKHKYGISKPYFLLVGAGSNYKNAILFFRAFAQLHSKQGFEIICTGSGVTLANEYRQYASGTVVHSLILSDEELKIAYSGAVALVYPSLYEGFGMPVLEALACGCPVITCANASIPEVAGESAIYVDSNDVDGLTDALCEVQKPKVRNSLIAAGLAQAKQFSWSNMADTISSALIKATLISFNLRDINLVVFPDWNQPEEVLYPELVSLIKALATHPNRSQITLLIDHQNISDEDADLALSSVMMNLLMEEELELDDSVEIVLIGQLNSSQWSALSSQLQGRIKLNAENQEAIASVGAEIIPVFDTLRSEDAEILRTELN
jgi:glycosyltransferase involved in cell wall biosynthesis